MGTTIETLKIVISDNPTVCVCVCVYVCLSCCSYSANSHWRKTRDTVTRTLRAERSACGFRPAKFRRLHFFTVARRAVHRMADETGAVGKLASLQLAYSWPRWTWPSRSRGRRGQCGQWSSAFTVRGTLADLVFLRDRKLVPLCRLLPHLLLWVLS